MRPSTSSSSKLKWKSDFDKSVILDNFNDRNWNKSQSEGNNKK